MADPNADRIDALMKALEEAVLELEVIEEPLHKMIRALTETIRIAKEMEEAQAVVYVPAGALIGYRSGVSDRGDGEADWDYDPPKCPRGKGALANEPYCGGDLGYDTSEILTCSDCGGRFEEAPAGN